jgi:hypothetical protein
MIDRNAILDVMEHCAAERLIHAEGYSKQGLLVVQVRSEQNPEQWESSMRFFGDHFRGPKLLDGREIDTGCNFDATVHGKIAYARRAGKNSGAGIYDLCGDESLYQGAVITDDGQCICAYSGLAEPDDLLVAQTGAVEYCRQTAAS